jgi:hypothetical protein
MRFRRGEVAAQLHCTATSMAKNVSAWRHICPRRMVAAMRGMHTSKRSLTSAAASSPVDSWNRKTYHGGIVRFEQKRTCSGAMYVGRPVFRPASASEIFFVKHVRISNYSILTAAARVIAASLHKNSGWEPMAHWLRPWPMLSTAHRADRRYVVENEGRAAIATTAGVPVQWF